MKQLDKLHIVHILSSLTVGGAQQSVFNLITHPKLRHFRHSIVCIKSSHGEFYEKFNRMGVPIYLCPIYWPNFSFIPFYRLRHYLYNNLIFIFYLRFLLLLKRIKADLVHSHLTPHISVQAKLVILKAKLPFIWTIRGMYRSRGLLKDTELLITLKLIEKSDKAAITAVSYAVLNDVLGNRELSKEKVKVIYNGVDLSKFETKSGQDKFLRKQWNIPENALIFGAAGRLTQEKRFDLLLDAAEEVIRKYSKVYVVIAGEGEMRQILEKQIERFGLKNRIYLVGYQSDMVQFWREIDVAVVSSDSEGLPNVLLEACASGVPCIATRVGGIPEVLGDEAGMLIEPNSREALVKAMEKMLDEKVRSEYRKKVKEVAKNFSIDRTVEQYNKLYQELLEIN